MAAIALSGCMRRSVPLAVNPQLSLGAIAYAGPAPASYDAPYHLDAGDKLRVVVYGQEGLTNTYSISAGGTFTMPLIGTVPARGRTPQGLAGEIAARLRNGFIREPSVDVEIEACRPFFTLGEVQAPGQYPYVPSMTAESAVAIAGGFSPRARKDRVTITHTDAAGTSRTIAPPGVRSIRATPCWSAALVLAGITRAIRSRRAVTCVDTLRHRRPAYSSVHERSYIVAFAAVNQRKRAAMRNRIFRSRAWRVMRAS